ncbi:MAG: 4a-hydroxytetrahydrobiopterin dehydratase [Candidatus Brocadiales bacterium]
MKKLEEREVSEKLKTLRDWTHDGGTIVKKYKFPNFRKAIKFVGMVADVAEELNHHPTIVINYNRVTLSLTTHSQGGLTGNDFRAAALIDGLLQKDEDFFAKR